MMDRKKALAKRHRAWKRRLAKNLPALATRVFALRGQPYMGSGFHWAMERTLGNVIRIANDHEARFDIGCAIVDEVIVCGLFEDVSKAEKSLKRHDD